MADTHRLRAALRTASIACGVALEFIGMAIVVFAIFAICVGFAPDLNR